MLLAGSLGGIACIGALVFWGLNQVNESGRKHAYRQQSGGATDWP